MSKGIFEKRYFFTRIERVFFNLFIMATLQSINPYNGEVNGTFETLSDEQILEKIEKAHAAFLPWKNTSFAERKELFYTLADVIEADLENYAKMQTLEMGMLFGPSKK